MDDLQNRLKYISLSPHLKSVAALHSKIWTSSCKRLQLLFVEKVVQSCLLMSVRACHSVCVCVYMHFTCTPCTGLCYKCESSCSEFLWHRVCDRAV